ncbi:hypothetical protein HRG_013767 [Hirsutella rhossiliensis]
MVILLRTDPFGIGGKQSFSFEKYYLVSPQEFDLILKGYLDPESLGLTMYYRTASISREVAQEACTVLMWAVNYIVLTEPSLGATSSTYNGDSYRLTNDDAETTESLLEKFFKYIFDADIKSATAF